MLRQLLCFLLALLPAGPALAQVYAPGWLVRATGDTLRGELENDFWDEPPTFVRYRAAPGSPSQLFQPRQVRAFSFTGGRYYQWQVLPIDHAAHTNLADLVMGRVTDVRQDSLLAEVLVEGPAMLWRARIQGTLHLLLRRPDQPVLELTERRYLRQDVNGSTVMVDGNNYRSQLAAYFGDCPAAVQAAATAAYTTRDVVGVVRAYYQHCAPGQGTARSWLARSEPGRQLAVQGGVLAGVRYNRIGDEGACTDCAARPFGGFYAEVLQPSRLAALYGELSLSSFRNTGTLYYYVKSPPSVFSYQALLLTARLGLRYLLPLPREHYLVTGLGLELNFIAQPTITQTSGPPTTFSRDYVQYATPALLPNLTLGWRYQRLTLLLDGQLYRQPATTTISEAVFGSGLAVRAGASLRLGPHPDHSRQRRADP